MEFLYWVLNAFYGAIIIEVLNLSMPFWMSFPLFLLLLPMAFFQVILTVALIRKRPITKVFLD